METGVLEGDFHPLLLSVLVGIKKKQNKTCAYCKTVGFVSIAKNAKLLHS